MGSTQIEILESRTMMSATAVHAVAKPAIKPAIKPVAISHAAVIKTVNPVVTASHISYKSFAGDPLFAANGPSISDINQGDLGDCYLLSALSSVARTDPALIRKDIVADGNGIYTVTFGSAQSARKINVSADLPVWPDGELAYARLGNQNSLWVALMEKAYVQYASPTNHYASIEGGWMSSAFSALGLKSSGIYSASSAATLMTSIKTDLSKGDFTTFGTVDSLAATSPLIASHAYEVNAVNVDSHGTPVSITMRNPWGDAVANDGYITVTAAQAFSAFSGVVISHA